MKAKNNIIFCGGYLPVLLVLSACFVSGAIVSCFFTSSFGSEGYGAMSSYINSFLSAASDSYTDKPGFAGALLSALRFPFFVCLLGFTSFGVYAVPAVLAARGFLLGFSVSSFFALFGSSGILLALAVFGPACAFSIPALFLFAAQSMSLSGRFLTLKRGVSKMRVPPIDKYVFLSRSAIYTAFIVLGALAEAMLSPFLIDTVVSRFL